MANKVTPVAGEFSLAISAFPESLHPILNSIDDEGNGNLELDEITDVFTMYADMKKAAKDGSIAISTLPKEIQPSLKVFDVDGDGSVAPMELARAAELYRESKNAVKRLSKAVAALVIVLGVLLGCLAGMVIAVVEAAKETETDGSGVTYVKGSNTPAASATVNNQFYLSDAPAQDFDTLDSINALRFTNTADETYSYTITGWKQAGDSDGAVTFYAARGDTVLVSGGSVTVEDTDGNVLYSETPAKRRSLLAAGGFPSSMSGPAGAFTTNGGGAPEFQSDLIVQSPPSPPPPPPGPPPPPMQPAMPMMPAMTPGDYSDSDSDSDMPACVTCPEEPETCEEALQFVMDGGCASTCPPEVIEILVGYACTDHADYDSDYSYDYYDSDYNCAPGCYSSSGWLGDEYCDDDCNNAACGYDHGDCDSDFEDSDSDYFSSS